MTARTPLPSRAAQSPRGITANISSCVLIQLSVATGEFVEIALPGQGRLRGAPCGHVDSFGQDSAR
eukprot:2607816-Pyramimonas_sp.AAC.1